MKENISYLFIFQNNPQSRKYEIEITKRIDGAFKVVYNGGFLTTFTIKNFNSAKVEEVKTLIEECKIETQILIKLYDEIKSKRKLSKIDLKQIIQNIALKYILAIQLEFQK